MKLKDIENKPAAILLLENSKRYLGYNTEFVCIALGNARRSSFLDHNGYPVESKAYGELLLVISKALGKSYTVDSWVCRNHPEAYKKIKSFHEYRLAWIDKMIEDLSD